ncbi:MAG TPA: RHS repeat-associated core domain-containing protein, partial [Pseudodesulfovibrio sp.]|nr:RHS repeat-associated core domain-containing protein [Pseudodesulfovibrio sp.]
GAGSFTYAWDAEQRLSQVTNPSDSWVYNTLGEQVADNGSSKLFDPAGKAVAVWVTGSGGYWYLNGIMRLGGRMLGQYKGGTTYMVHENALGSTSMLTGPAGAEKSDFVFLPYGNLWKAGPAYEYHFAGFDFHGGWGFYGTNARLYHWDLGSWLTPDPTGGDVTNPQSFNRYAYVLNNPATLTDPLGLDSGGPTQAGGCPNSNPAGINAQGETIYTSCNAEEAAQSNEGGPLGHGMGGPFAPGSVFDLGNIQVGTKVWGITGWNPGTEPGFDPSTPVYGFMDVNFGTALGLFMGELGTALGEPAPFGSAASTQSQTPNKPTKKPCPPLPHDPSLRGADTMFAAF